MSMLTRRWSRCKSFAMCVLVCAVVVSSGCTGARHRPLVALLTDYGSADAYTGVLQATIVRQCRDVTLVPITHEVPDFDIRAGSFILGIAAPAFPADTVFCVVVDPGVGTSRRSIILRTKDGRTFVGPDNGIFTDVAANEGVAGVWALDEARFAPPGALSRTFHGRDVYGPVAGMLAAGAKPERLGTAIERPVTFALYKPRRDGQVLTGVVRLVDGYGNIITNIPGEWIPANPGAPIDVTIKGQTRTYARQSTYAEASEGSGVVLVNSLGVVEIARNQAAAATEFPGAGTGSGVELHLP